MSPQLKTLQASSPRHALQQFLSLQESRYCRWLRVNYLHQSISGEPCSLAGFYQLNDEKGVRAVSVIEGERADQLADAVVAQEDLLSAAAMLDVACFELDKPLGLEPLSIPKPWGQEIWYTGVEARGICRFLDTNGRAVPIPWLVECLPEASLVAQAEQLILLKILDPLPEPVYGDLYFELHQEKREVYVVTAVDSRAWPSGEGAIRFGFNQQLVGQLGEEQFRHRYCEAVEEYRAIRVEMDRYLDAIRLREGVALDAPVAAQTLKAWVQELPAQLLDRESLARASMERYTAMRTLRVGDVLKVPCGVPHSLQHGVRTVEFQTPVYERMILSFAQKVLTQSHWDTQQALEIAQFSSVTDESIEPLIADDVSCVERIVDFEDFEVQRITLQPNAHLEFADRGCYSVLMGVQGSGAVNGGQLQPEQAVLVLAGHSMRIDNRDAGELIVLLAYPKQPKTEC